MVDIFPDLSENPMTAQILIFPVKRKVGYFRKSSLTWNGRSMFSFFLAHD